MLCVMVTAVNTRWLLGSSGCQNDGSFSAVSRTDRLFYAKGTEAGFEPSTRVKGESNVRVVCARNNH